MRVPVVLPMQKYGYLALPMPNQQHNWNWSVKYFILRIRFSKISLFGMVSKRLKLPNFFNGVARPFPTHKGRNLKNLAKKLFSQFRVAKNKFHHFWPPVEKLLENPLVAPLKKFLPTPMHTSMKMTPFLWKIVLYYTISQHWWTTPMRQAIHSGVTQWCRWRGCRRCKRTFFDLVKSGQNQWKSGKIL